jgi:hypothetical protein
MRGSGRSLKRKLGLKDVPEGPHHSDAVFFVKTASADSGCGIRHNNSSINREEEEGLVKEERVPLKKKRVIMSDSAEVFRNLG